MTSTKNYRLTFQFVCSRILIDTADGEQPEFFLNLKKSINFDKFGISGVILTHWHHDHIGGVGTCTASVGGVMKSAEVTKSARLYFWRGEGRFKF